MSEPVCGTCAHWKKRPTDPMNLGAPATGECRAVPPSVTLLPTPQGLAQASAYPQLPETFLACGLYHVATVNARAGANGSAILSP